MSERSTWKPSMASALGRNSAQSGGKRSGSNQQRRPLPHTRVQRPTALRIRPECIIEPTEIHEDLCVVFGSGVAKQFLDVAAARDLISRVRKAHESHFRGAHGNQGRDTPTPDVPGMVAPRASASEEHPDDAHPRSSVGEILANKDSFIWLSLYEPDAATLQKIASDFGIHELIVDDILGSHQRPKMERFGEQVHLVVKTVNYIAEEDAKDAKEIISTGEISIVLGPQFIITITDGNPSVINHIHQHFRTDDRTLNWEPITLAWFIMDHLVDDYLRIAAMLETDVDDLELTVFSPKARFDIEQIYLLKRENLEMRRAIVPVDPMIRNLLVTSSDIIDDQQKSYFRDIAENSLVASDEVQSFDERLSALIDAGSAKISIQQNNDMRKISAVAGLALPPTVFAGIWGMNFDNMPILHWEYGYYFALGLMATLMLLVFLIAVKNKWL